MDPSNTSALIVARLTRQQIRSAYSLMQAADPSLRLVRWLRYARRVADQADSASDGMLVARRGATSHPCGAVCYQRVRHLRHGPVLTAEHFIALDLLQPEAVLSALAAELEVVAARLGCGTIRSIVHGSGAAVLGHLHSTGHILEGILLTKSLD